MTPTALLDELRAAARAGEVLPLGAPVGERATVDAALLRRLCLEVEDVDPHGLMIENACVTGPLDLNAVNLPFALWFTDTTFDEPVQLMYARLSLLTLENCTLPRLAAGRLQVDGDLSLDGCTMTSGVMLAGARVGALTVNGTTVGQGDHNSALRLDDMHVDEDVGLTHGFVARGNVSFRRTRVGGILAASGARIEDGGFLLDAADIGGDVYLDDGFRADGGVSGDGVRIGGSLSFAGAVVRGGERDALGFSRASIDGTYTSAI